MRTQPLAALPAGDLEYSAPKRGRARSGPLSTHVQPEDPHVAPLGRERAHVIAPVCDGVDVSFIIPLIRFSAHNGESGGDNRIAGRNVRENQMVYLRITTRRTSILCFGRAGCLMRYL